MLGVSVLLALLVVVLGSLPDRQTDFGLKVFSELVRRSPDRNLVFSPHGAASIVAMAQLGADGSTLTELTEATGFSLRDRGMPRQQRLLQRDLAREAGVQLAGAVMVERRLTLEKGFRRALAKTFQNRPQQVDFSEPDRAVAVINSWVSDHTAGTVPEFLVPGSLTEETRLVLLSALHFQGSWELPFDPRLTQERLFHGANGTAAPVHMMRLTGSFNYGEFVTSDGVDYDVIELQYAGDALSMLLVSPFEADAPLSSLGSALSSRTLRQWRSQMRSSRRQLAMPRFTLSSQLNLKAVLQDLGLQSMFNPATAHFTRITADERLSVSKVLQRVEVQVEEQGTRGSAATAAIMFSRMAVEEMTLDRPFLFLIQHKPTGAVLFAGHFSQAEQS